MRRYRTDDELASATTSRRSAEATTGSRPLRLFGQDRTTFTNVGKSAAMIMAFLKRTHGNARPPSVSRGMLNRAREPRIQLTPQRVLGSQPVRISKSAAITSSACPKRICRRLQATALAARSRRKV